MIRYDNLLQNVTDLITKCDSCFITTCDRSLLQNVSSFLLQNATVFLKMQQFLQIVTISLQIATVHAHYTKIYSWTEESSLNTITKWLQYAAVTGNFPLFFSSNKEFIGMALIKAEIWFDLV